MAVSSHLVQTEQAIMHISCIVTSLLFSAPVRAEVDLIAGDSCALLTTAYSNAEQSFMVILTSVARKNYPSPFPKGPRWLMPFNMKFYKLEPLYISTCSLIFCILSLVLVFIASPSFLHHLCQSLPPFPLSIRTYALQDIIWYEISAFIPYVIYQCFLKGSGVGFDRSCIKNTRAYCCQLHPLLFIRFDRWGYLKPPCFIQLVASQRISGELSRNLSSPDFLIRI